MTYTLVIDNRILRGSFSWWDAQGWAKLLKNHYPEACIKIQPICGAVISWN